MARPRIPVVYKGEYWPSARALLLRLGVSQYRRQLIRNELKDGSGMFRIGCYFIVRADLA